MDERFARVRTDPRFKKPARNERKVKIDKRFQKMFKDDRFREKYTVDKLGRKSAEFSSNKDLQRYYDLSSSEEEEEEADDIRTNNRTIEDKQKNVLSLRAGGVDLSRGEGNVESSSSEDESDDSAIVEDSDDTSNDEFEHKWAEFDVTAPRVDSSTHRLAVCNMDWDRVKASDLYMLFNSFKPAGAIIKSVMIYPSDFGVERLKEEEKSGPAELTKRTPNDRKMAAQFEDEDQYCTEKLRQYQLNRMKYYYAVLECDTPDTASAIYTQCDGVEYESSSNKLDLRFIPDHMTFTDHSPKSECSSVPTSAPTDYHTTALHQTKVELTWDETNPDRVKKTSKLYKTIEDIDEDLNAYLASSTSESEEDEQIPTDKPDDDDEEEDVDKYKSLMNNIESCDQGRYDKHMEMEVTWEPGLKETTEELVQSKDTAAQNKDITPWQKYVDKKKAQKKDKKLQKKLNEKNISDSDSEQSEISNRKQKSKKKSKQLDSDDEKERENLSLLLMDDAEDKKGHFNLSSIIAQEKVSGKKKRNKRKREQKEAVDDFTINTDDSRFRALYETTEYAIDPSNPQFKTTSAMTEIMNERLKRRRKNNKNQEDEIRAAEGQNNTTSNLSSLMKSVKSRAGLYHKNKK